LNSNDKLLLKLIFSEVIQGYSLVNIPSLGEIKVKHLNSLDAAEIDILKDKYFTKAKEQGLPTQQDKLDELHKEGLWTQEDEKKIQELTSYLSNLRHTKKSLFLEKDKKPVEEKIKLAEEKVYRNQARKTSLIGLTCDLYAEKRISEYYILFSLRDANNDNLFPRGSMENFSEDLDTELFDEIKYYHNLKIGKISSQNLKRISISPFFLNFYVLCDKNPKNFFGKPIVELTFHQAELANHARHMLSVIENAKNPAPDYLYENPDELIAFYEGQVNSNELDDKSQGKDGSTIVGASKEELKNLGVGQNESNSKDLAKEAFKKGGSLSMQDLMKIHGVK